jgi:hypothetical protein
MTHTFRLSGSGPSGVGISANFFIFYAHLYKHHHHA